MSKNLQSIPALIELTDSHISEPLYKETKIELTVFAGGSVRGKSLQIGYTNDLEMHHKVQLSNKDTINLIKLLQEEFLSNYKL